MSRPHAALAALWPSAAPAEPSEADWAGLLERIAARLPARPRRRSPALSWFLAGLVATAATVGLVVALRLPAPTPTPPDPPRTPWPVALAGDVDIITMDGSDVPFLIVGQPPVRGPLIPVLAGDVTIADTGHDVEVFIPDANLAGQAAPPMIIMPLDPK